MPLNEAQYRLIEEHLPTQRGNVSVTNLRVLNAILYLAEHDCSWRQLPKRFGNWHTVYTRMNRWSRSGVLDRVFAQLQHEGILRVSIEVREDKAAGQTADKLSAARRAAIRASSQLVWVPKLLVRD